MSGNYPVRQFGPTTYKVNAAVTGGQLVMPDSTTGKVKPATAGAKTVLGMAMTDASPAGSGSNLSFATNQPEVAVAYAPAEVLLLASANIAFGEQVVAAAAGAVAPVASGTFDQIVGRCTAAAGIVSGARGLVRLGVN